MMMLLLGHRRIFLGRRRCLEGLIRPLGRGGRVGGCGVELTGGYDYLGALGVSRRGSASGLLRWRFHGTAMVSTITDLLPAMTVAP
jgi:hypothetical protein